MRRIGAITAGTALLLIAVWYMALFRPQSSGLTKAHHAYAASAQEVAQLKQQVVSLQALERGIPSDKAKLNVLNAAVPSTTDLQDLLNQLHQSAVTSGVQLTSVSPSTASSSSGSDPSQSASAVKQLGLSMSLAGTYPQVMTFFKDLSYLSRVLVIDTATFSPSATGLVSTSVTGRAFYAP
jgi:Tfp pilus assembly protein PilO